MQILKLHEPNRETLNEILLVQPDGRRSGSKLASIGAIVWSLLALALVVLLGLRPRGTIYDPARYISHLACIALALILSGSVAVVWLQRWWKTKSQVAARLACLAGGLTIIITADGWYARWQGATFERMIQADERYRVFLNGFVRSDDLKRNVLRHHKTDNSVGPFTAGYHCRLLDSEINIGPMGFRCHSHRSIDKHSRLVLCVGGSVIFGMTTHHDDRPFPDILEDLLTQTSEAYKPVRVLNAGIPGMSFHPSELDAIARWLTLKPDVVLVYEGINYLPIENHWQALPRNSGLASWLDRERIRLGSEWRIRDYTGEEYRRQVLQLLDLIDAVDATPVLVTFATAFTSESDDATFRYFDVMQNGHGSARAACKLVETHNQVLKEIAAQRHVLCIDLATKISGHEELFIDTCHFTQAGRQRVAESLAAALRSLLVPHVVSNGINAQN